MPKKSKAKTKKRTSPKPSRPVSNGNKMVASRLLYGNKTKKSNYPHGKSPLSRNNTARTLRTARIKKSIKKAKNLQKNTGQGNKNSNWGNMTSGW